MERSDELKLTTLDSRVQELTMRSTAVQGNENVDRDDLVRNDEKTPSNKG